MFLIEFARSYFKNHLHAEEERLAAEAEVQKREVVDKAAGKAAGKAGGATREREVGATAGAGEAEGQQA